jgi:DNA adenine methylase
MKYLGGKWRIAKKIADYIKEHSTYDTFFSPFCGSLAVENQFCDKKRILNDIMPDLIMFWEAYKDGFIPEPVSEEDYRQLKYEQSSPRRGFSGFFLSYNGKWFGGYLKNGKTRNRDFFQEAIKSLQKIKLNETIFHNKSYTEFNPVNQIIYVDPPYQGTTKYTHDIDYDVFWNTMRKWSENNEVFISEYQAPHEDWECVLEIPTRSALAKEKRTEKLFRYLKTESLVVSK